MDCEGLPPLQLFHVIPRHPTTMERGIRPLPLAGKRAGVGVEAQLTDSIKL